MARIDTFQRHGGSHTGSAAAEEEEEKLESPHHAASACRAVQFDGSTRIVLKNSMSSFPVWHECKVMAIGRASGHHECYSYLHDV